MKNNSQYGICSLWIKIPTKETDMNNFLSELEENNLIDWWYWENDLVLQIHLYVHQVQLVTPLNTIIRDTHNLYFIEVIL